MLNFRTILGLAVLVSPAILLSQAAPSASTDNSTLQVTSRIVYVDVVVRDRAGRVVRGLTANDFHLSEDGKPQAVAFFADHSNDFSAASAVPASKLSFSNVGPTSNSVNIILVDFYNTATQDQPYARKQIVRFLESLPRGHQTALFVLGNHLQMLQNFTGSTDRLVAAAKAMDVKPSDTLTTAQQQRQQDFVTEFVKAMGPSASPYNAAADGLNLEGGDKAQRAIDITQHALNQIAAAVSGYPGRKNLYWLADQFPLYGGPALEIHELADDISTNTMGPVSITGKMAGVPGLMSTQDIAEANHGLANAQVAVYPILLTGLDASGMDPGARNSTSIYQLFTQRAEIHTMMDNLANSTGGHAYYGTNDFAGALRNGFEDGSSYYTLAYIPHNGNWNGAFRKIKVKVTQPGDSLSYRRGYYATGAIAARVTSSQELSAALQPATPESTMLRLSSSLVPPTPQNPYLLIKTGINPEGIDFTTDANGVRHAKLLVLLIALNQTGPQPQAPPQASGVLHLDFTPAQYHAVLKTGIGFALRMKLKPGSYRLRLGVSDMNNHRLGTLDMPVTVN